MAADRLEQQEGQPGTAVAAFMPVSSEKMTMIVSPAGKAELVAPW